MKMLSNIRISSIIWMGLLILFPLIAYHGVIRADFIGFDDNVYVTENRVVQDGLTETGIEWAFKSVYASTWQPLVWISYMLDITIFGKNPAGFHITNLILHICNVLLFFGFARKLTNNHMIAGIAAVLLAIHPIHVESVAWIAERKGLLSALFWWLSALSYLHYRHTHKMRFFFMSIAAMALGLMAKPMLITLPFTFILIDAWVCHQNKSKINAAMLKQSIRMKGPLFALSLISTIITFYAQHKGDSFLSLETVSLWERIANALVSIYRYAFHLFAPIRLSILYPHPGNWPLYIVLPACIGLGIFAYLIVRTYKAHPWIGLGVAWFMITIFPVLGIAQFGRHAMADRFMYIPAAGLYILAGVGIGRLMHFHRWIVGGTSLALAILLTIQTQRQTAHWQDSIRLFSHAVDVTKNNWVMLNSLGSAYSRAGRHAEAAPHFVRSLEINPNNAKALFNLGNIRFYQERWSEAAELFEKSLAQSPNYQAQYNLAVTYTRAGLEEKARHTYLNILEDHPHHISALINLGRLYQKEGKHAQAIACYRLVKKIDPGNTAGRTGEAISVLATAKDPMPAIAELIRLLEEDASNAEAREALNKAIRGNP